MSHNNPKRTIKMDVNVEEIYRMRSEGMTNEQIANALGISVSSVYRYAGRMSEAVKHAEVQNKPCPIPDPIKFTPVKEEEPKPEPKEAEQKSPKKDEHFSFTTDRFGNVISISPRNTMDEKLSLFSKTLVDLEETKKEVQAAQETKVPQLSGKERRKLEREKRKQEEMEKQKKEQEEIKMEGRVMQSTFNAVEEAEKKINDDAIEHYSTPRNSGRYPAETQPNLFEVLSTRTVLKGSLCNWIVDTESGSIEMTDGVLSGLLDKDSLKRYMDELNAVAEMLGV